MPKDFVKLSTIDPSIRQSIRYSSSENFLGRPVPGYTFHEIYCTKQMALQLAKINQALQSQGYTLVIYDAYRPQRAVDAFIAWSKDPNDTIARAYYYPAVAKEKLFELKYIAERSAHSRGSTVDLTLIRTKQSLKPIKYSQRKLTNGLVIPYLDDSTVDMGSSFDLFSPVSHHDFPYLSAAQQSMRLLLLKTMQQYGFDPVDEEWWHYTLQDEPYPDTYFDFIPNSF